MDSFPLTILHDTFRIHRLEAETPIPVAVLASPFFAVLRTKEELTLVASESIAVKSQRMEADWACFKVDGNLDFSLVGILARLTGVLAKAHIPVFVLSTFSTDFLLVKRDKVDAAKSALSTSGYQITEEDQG